MPAASPGADRPPGPASHPLTDDVLFTRAPGAIVAFDADGRIQVVNPAACRLAQRRADELVGQDVRALLHPDRGIIELPTGDAVVDHDVRLLEPDGTIRRLRARVLAHGALHVAFLEDLTDQLRRIADAETSTGERYEKLLQNIDDVITVCDEHGTVLTNLGHFNELLGWPSSYWEGRSVFEFAHPDEIDDARRAFELLLRMPGVPIIRDFRTLDAHGRWNWLQFTATNLLDDPTLQAVVLVSRNVTLKKQSESLQKSQSEIFELIACAAPLDLVLARLGLLVEEHVPRSTTGFFVLDDQGDVRAAAGSRLPDTYVQALAGPRANWFGSVREALLTGRSATVTDLSAALQAHATPAVFGSTRATVSLPIDDDLSEHGPCGVLEIHLADPRTLTEAEELVALAAARLAAIALQRHRTQVQLWHLAHHDRLTSLPNRARLQERLDDAIQHARDHNSAIAVMFLDVDNFKIVNDSLGHTAGDHVLIGFAERLAAMLRPDDTVGRFGGDEFVVLLENITDADDAVLVAERLLEDLQHPLRIGDQTVFLSVSVGIAVSIGGHDSADVLLRNADSAMYQAKSKGRARVEVFDDGLPERSARRLQLEGDLHRALDEQQFVLHWQPKVALDTGRIVSAEALVRWNHPERGLIQPTEFIRVTEEIELIVRIGSWVLDEAIRQRAAWEAEHGDEAPWSIAVNFSALQLAAPRAMESVLQVLERWHWAPERLVLELTESVLMDDAAGASPILEKFTQLGVQIAIDDFGTGYSSLSYLHRYPVDQVKLDRSFVGSIDQHGEGSAIARAVINMAHALDITVTAEGVETDAQRRGLRVLGCDRAQGFLFSPPLPAEEFSALLRRKPRYA